MKKIFLLCVFAVVSSATLFYVPTFDFDGNLLETDGRFHVEHLSNGVWYPYNATLKEWAAILARGDKTYRVSQVMDYNRDFSDENGWDNFEHQVERAVPNKTCYGSAFSILRAHIQHGNYFHIITARKHFSSSIELAMRKFIESSLEENDFKLLQKSYLAYTAPLYNINTNKGWYGERVSTVKGTYEMYLRGCEFYGVGEPSWYARRQCNKTNECKALVVESLTENVDLFIKKGAYAVVSFSDDEEPNLSAVKEKMMNKLAVERPNVCFRVYDTSDMKKAKQININKACEDIPLDEDYESKSFLSAFNGEIVKAY